MVPPKPKKSVAHGQTPLVPRSQNISNICKPSYSSLIRSSASSDDSSQFYANSPTIYDKQQQQQQPSKVTLDNSIQLQLKKEALEHRKKMLEAQKLYSNETAQYYENVAKAASTIGHPNELVYSNIMHNSQNNASEPKTSILYSQNIGDLPPPPIDFMMLQQQQQNQGGNKSSELLINSELNDDEFPPPPSPVSSSYSELRRATDGVSSVSGDVDNSGYATTIIPPPIMHHNFQMGSISQSHHPMKAYNQGYSQQQTYSNDYGIYGPSSQNSTTYESIYEPINPRPQSQMSSRSNYSLYTPYVSGSQDGMCSSSSSMNKLPIINQESEVDALTDLLVQSMHQSNPDSDNYGICVKCNGRIVGETSGCTAMDKIYHISCFTCQQCQLNLQGKPFYALDGKPYCEDDYLNTLEKCSVCYKPILERILRATGKPYHPQCFTCIVCGKSLDGIPFTVDATNQIHCIEDFHK